MFVLCSRVSRLLSSTSLQSLSCVFLCLVASMLAHFESSRALLETASVVTQRAYARGKVFVTTKIARSPGSGITVVSKFAQMVGSCEKPSAFCFLTLGTRRERYKIGLLAAPINHSRIADPQHKDYVLILCYCACAGYVLCAN